MRLAQVLDIRQQQTQRVDPRQILASELLSLTLAELDSVIEREMAENPALEAADVEGGIDLPQAERDPTIDSLLTSSTRLTLSTDGYDDQFGLRLSSASTVNSDTAFIAPSTAVAESVDPLEFATSAPTLREHLRTQISQVATEGTRVEIVRYLIECIDERGYLPVEVDEIADDFEATIGEVEDAVSVVQAMDPPGVGARDLQECLLLQLDNLDESDNICSIRLVRQILSRCWEDLAAHREDRIAGRLRVTVAQVQRAVAFVRSSLTPYPSSAFRPERTIGRGRVGASDAAHDVQPDIIFRRTEAGFTAEMTRNYESMLTVAPLWKRLAERGNIGADEAMKHYICDHVARAQTFVTGLSRRGSTLRRIAVALIAHQQGYLETGNRAFLRPLTRQALSEHLQIDESVISRAVADKWAQLPVGDVVPLDAFFGNANAVREALAVLIANEQPSKPYSDDELAELLAAQGFALARRTVAKFRSLERILPARLRRIRSVGTSGTSGLRLAA